MTKKELTKIELKSIEIQERLYKRMKGEKGTCLWWTTKCIAYQKQVYKAAMHELGGGFVVDGVKPVDYAELRRYYNEVVDI